jgi:hypothetical protein
MPKIYDQKQEPGSRPDTPSGGPATRTRNRGTMLALAAILAVIIIIMLYRLARGEDFQVALTQPAPPAITSLDQVARPYPDLASELLRYWASPSL